MRRGHDELERHAAARDIDGCHRANPGLHSFAQRPVAKRWLDRVTSDLGRFMRLMRGRQLALPGRIEASFNEYRVLIDAFEQRDAARAERAMHEHLMAQRVALKKLRRTQPRVHGRVRTATAKPGPRHAR